MNVDPVHRASVALDDEDVLRRWEYWYLDVYGMPPIDPGDPIENQRLIDAARALARSRIGGSDHDV